MAQCYSQFIHAPREGCDLTNFTYTRLRVCFNSRTPGGVRRVRVVQTVTRHVVSIHAPREGCDLFGLNKPNTNLKFQFTHPGRGATGAGFSLTAIPRAFQFTHPGRGATGAGFSLTAIPRAFQFTHPGRGATLSYQRRSYRSQRFNSRTPGGVRLPTSGSAAGRYQVSIHAPREGCDTATRYVYTIVSGFNSRTPGGVRLHSELQPD